jgi:nucleotide-binding universal stress UspA family protein
MSTNRKSPDDSEAVSGRIVVGVHGSRSSLRALRYAVRIARDRGWNLEIVTAWPDADDPWIHDVPGRYITARGHAVECQREALATLVPELAAAVETYLVNARPAEALMSRCDDADLLVVGAGQPESALGRRSVAAVCLGAAPCAVSVVPDPEEALRGGPQRHHRPGVGTMSHGVARDRRTVTADGQVPIRGPAERPVRG